MTPPRKHHSMRRISEMTDEQLAWRYKELRYRMLECAVSPDHPTTKANRARWTREYEQAERALERRGLFEDQTEDR